MIRRTVVTAVAFALALPGAMATMPAQRVVASAPVTSIAISPLSAGGEFFTRGTLAADQNTTVTVTAKNGSSPHPRAATYPFKVGNRSAHPPPRRAPGTAP